LEGGGERVPQQGKGLLEKKKEPSKLIDHRQLGARTGQQRGKTKTMSNRKKGVVFFVTGRYQGNFSLSKGLRKQKKITPVTFTRDLENPNVSPGRKRKKHQRSYRAEKVERTSPQ